MRDLAKAAKARAIANNRRFRQEHRELQQRLLLHLSTNDFRRYREDIDSTLDRLYGNDGDEAARLQNKADIGTEQQNLDRWIAEGQERAARRQKIAEETEQPIVKRRRQDSLGMAEAKERAIVVLELFSGIGGMHFALREAGVTNAKIAAAMDISDVANKVYKHNFPETNHVAGNICGLTAKK